MLRRVAHWRQSYRRCRLLWCSRPPPFRAGISTSRGGATLGFASRLEGLQVLLVISSILKLCQVPFAPDIAFNLGETWQTRPRCFMKYLRTFGHLPVLPPSIPVENGTKPKTRC